MVRDLRPRRDAPVAFHRHDREVATESVLGIHEPRDLSGRHPMANGNRVETDEREKLFLGQVPLDDLPTERIRPIEDDDGDPARGTGPVSYTHLRAHETGSNLVCRL